MKLDKNTAAFSSPLHQTLWRAYIEYMSFERSTQGITDEKLLASIRDFYGYIQDGLNDMLACPGAYGIDPEERATFCGKSDFHRIIVEQWFTIALAWDADSLTMASPDYEKLMKNLKGKLKQSINFTDSFTFDDLINTLKRHGMVIVQNEAETVVTNTVYPRMFQSAGLLHQAAVRYYDKNKRSPQCFRMLDFRSLAPKRKIELEDVIDPLSDEQKKYLAALIAYVSAKVTLKVKAELWYYRAASFCINNVTNYKKRYLFLVTWGKAYGLEINIPYPDPGTDACRFIEAEIEKLPNSEEVKDFCLQHVKTCKFCSQNCMQRNAFKKSWTMFGRPIPKLVRSCERHIAVQALDDTSLAHFKTLIDLWLRYREQAEAAI